MVNPLLPKASETPGAVPTPSDLLIGQIGVNRADGKLFIRKSDGSIAEIGDVSTAMDSTARALAESALANIAHSNLQQITEHNASSRNMVNGFVDKAANLTVLQGNYQPSTNTVNASYLTPTNTDVVPTMTAATNGAVTISDSGITNPYYSYYAFNNNVGPYIANGPNAWMKIDLGSPTNLLALKQNTYSSAAQHMKDWKVEGSLNDVNWTELYSVTGAVYATSTDYTHNFTIQDAWRYARIWATATNGGVVAIHQFHLLGATSTAGNLQVNTPARTATGSAPQQAYIWATIEGVPLADIDLKFSTDGGSTFTTATGLLIVDSLGDVLTIQGTVDLTGNSGTGVIAQAVTKNNAAAKVHALSSIFR